MTNKKEAMIPLTKQERLELHKKRCLEGESRKSPKHTNHFKYQRNSSEMPLSRVNAFVRALKKHNDHVEVQTPKTYMKKITEKSIFGGGRKSEVQYATVVWYTRQDQGPKEFCKTCGSSKHTTDLCWRNR